MFSRRTNWNLAPNAFTKAIAEARASGRELIDLTISNPLQAGIEPDMEAVLAALCNPEAANYDPEPRGMVSARRAVCNYYHEAHGIYDLDPDRLFLTTGTSEAYSYIFRLLANPHDEILVPKPSYPLFEFLADLADVTPVAYPLVYDHGWQIDFDSLYRARTPRTRAIIVVHPNNPTGSYVDFEQGHALNEFCRDYETALIADEVFLDYAHDGAPRSSFVNNSEVLTFALSGVSKVSALPQMKLAWFVVSGPRDRVNPTLERMEVIADTYLSVNTPVQLAAPVLLEQRKEIQPLLIDRARLNLAELDHQLANYPSCTRLQTEGGWYAILRVPAVQSDEEQAIGLVAKAGVVVHPGHFYDFAGEGYLVLSLIPDPVDFREGVRRVLEIAGAAPR